MNNKDFLEVVEERKVEGFLKSTFGDKAVDKVVKYYDESYQGYLFLVQMAEGINFLPQEEGNYLRLGKYGFVTDDLTKPIPEAKDDKALSLQYEDFLSQYALFINNEVYEQTGDKKAYIEKFKNEMMVYLMHNKVLNHEKIITEYNLRKRYVYDILDSATEPGKE